MSKKAVLRNGHRPAAPVSWSHAGGGWIEIVVGSMFSGKSEELIRRLTRARIARQKVQVFKPGIDARYSVEEIASHSGQKHLSIPVSTTAEMMDQVHPDTEVVGIDEAQFFDMAIIAAVVALSLVVVVPGERRARARAQAPRAAVALRVGALDSVRLAHLHADKDQRSRDDQHAEDDPAPTVNRLRVHVSLPDHLVCGCP